jgi:FixJ family two-component response regulator
MTSVASISSMNNATIYIVDDDEGMRNSLKLALEQMKYRIKAFSSPELFLHNAQDIESPGVVLLDMQMPEITGVEIQNELMKMGICTPIIFMSGQSRPQQIIDSMRNGAYHFLLKPFDLGTLKECIEKALKKDDKNRVLITKYNALTPKEKETFQELASGKLIKQIALQRKVSESVIKLHKARAMEKLGIKSLQALTLVHEELQQHLKQSTHEDFGVEECITEFSSNNRNVAPPAELLTAVMAP